MVNLEPVRIRETIVRAMRGFFYEKGFHEVIVPVLNRSVPHEANLHPFKAGEYFLSLSPERGLKRMIAKGGGNCFAIAKSFRDLEASGSQHMAEFLMLEWYRNGAGYRDIIAETEALIRRLCEEAGRTDLLNAGFRTVSLADLFRKHANLDMEEIVKRDEALYAAARRKGYPTEGASWRELWDQLFVNEIEPLIGTGGVFVTDYPSRISPLCKQKEDAPHVSERFELYLNGIELANGNTENTDADSVRDSFERERAAQSGARPIDEEFLRSLALLDGQSLAGCGLGIDRLAMLLSGAASVREVEPLSEA